MRYALVFPFVLAACSTVDQSRLSTGGDALSGAYARVVLLDSTGTRVHSTGATTIDDGTYTLVDPDGLAANGLLTDGISALIITPAQGFSTNYDFVRAYNQAYIASGVPYAVEGVIGVVTQDADMPTSGSASWRGEAEGSFKTAAGTVDLDGGTAVATANFGAGRISILDLTRSS